jgi:curved DNA-binding protein CbpA
VKGWSRREILAYLDRVEPVLDRLDHFELLDVSADSSADQLQESFHNIAGGIHPDRLRKSLTVSQKERLTIVYARIAAAYRILKDPEKRDKYLRDELRKRADSPDTKEQALDPGSQLALLSPTAQRHYRRAMAALRIGDRTSALLNLKMALAKHPQSSILKEALQRAAARKR